MRDEGHHHLVFENAYVHVFFVEIPAHEATLLHHHDLPYVSVPPGGAEAMPSPPAISNRRTGPNFPHVGYAAGNLTHAVTNSSDGVLRNVAVELVRPQGTIRNRCIAVVRDQPLGACDVSDSPSANSSGHIPLFESDEILVESWGIDAATTTAPLNDGLDMLVGGLTGVRITGESGLDSKNSVRGGVLWVPAGSNPVFTTASTRSGHFVTITFKDTAQTSR